MFVGPICLIFFLERSLYYHFTQETCGLGSFISQIIKFILYQFVLDRLIRSDHKGIESSKDCLHLNKKGKG